MVREETSYMIMFSIHSSQLQDAKLIKSILVSISSTIEAHLGIHAAYVSPITNYFTLPTSIMHKSVLSIY